MRIIRILQIGDIHYRDEENFRPALDNKDSGFPDKVREAIGTTPLQAVFRDVARVIEMSNVDVVTFMGDLTTRGDRAALEACAEYVRKLFPEPWPEKDRERCKIVIGNHDIDRSFNPDTDERFDDVNSVLTSCEFLAASVDTPSELTVQTAPNACVKVFGLNSCRGCGQVRLLGGLVEKLVGPEIKRLLTEGGDEGDLLEIYEQLDTPAIDATALDFVKDRLESEGENVMPVICAHHNLLPQAMPRLAPYTELVNGGAVRNHLLSLGRPVIYLHGHLHTDPIEMIRVPGDDKAAVVSISAPLFRDGYNALEIAFNEDSVPLGCLVRRRRWDNGNVIDRPTQLIPFWSAAVGLGLATRAARSIMKDIEADKVYYRGDLLTLTGLPDDELDSALNELLWLGIAEISNSDRPSTHWRIVRKI